MAIGFAEVLVLFLVVLLVFGPQRIQELARALGRASCEFKKAKESFHKEGSNLLDGTKDVICSDEREA